jgi:PadR family transcriptional regulator PadR
VLDCEANLFYFVIEMPKGEFLGDLEQAVLFTVHRLGDNAYGVTIRHEIEKRTGRGVSIGAVYMTLDRLEKKRYVDSTVGDPTPERGGRAKRFYSVTRSGLTALQRTYKAVQGLLEGLSFNV